VNEIYSGVRSAARGAALTGLAALYKFTGATKTALNRNRVQVLTFHDVPSYAERQFRDLLVYLSEDHQFISYSDAIDRILRGPVDRPYLSITVDDGLYSNKRVAEILSDLDIPGCFFVCPIGLSATSSSQAQEFCLQLGIEPMRLLSWKDAEEVLRLGLEIGGHSLHHRDIAGLSQSQIESEIGGCFSTLRSRFGGVKHFAWPFGTFGHFTAAAAQIVFDSGFISCASGVRGCHGYSRPQHHTSLCVHRDVLEPHWRRSHVNYFLARNSNNKMLSTTSWPDGWFPNQFNKI
jgi:peptidoglycan/xylan/chitin deacetylase (PgdA/CDA1 family)